MIRVLAQVLLLADTGTLLWLADPLNPASSLFSYHPSAMIIMVFLAFEGILNFRSFPPKWRINLHGLFLGIGLTFGIGGLYAIYRNKNLQGKEHFTTWHGLLGLISLLLMIGQGLGGVLAKYSGIRRVGDILKKASMSPGLLKKGHRLNGRVLVPLLATTASLGICSNWFSAVTSDGLFKDLLCWQKWLGIGALSFTSLVILKEQISNRAKNL